MCSDLNTLEYLGNSKKEYRKFSAQSTESLHKERKDTESTLSILASLKRLYLSNLQQLEK